MNPRLLVLGLSVLVTSALLAADPAETTNVAAEHPDIAARAAALMKSSRTPSWEPKWNF